MVESVQRVCEKKVRRLGSEAWTPRDRLPMEVNDGSERRARYLASRKISWSYEYSGGRDGELTRAQKPLSGMIRMGSSFAIVACSACLYFDCE